MVDMTSAETKQWDPGLYLEGEHLWKKVNEKNRLVNLFRFNLNKLWTDIVDITNDIAGEYISVDKEKRKNLILDRDSMKNQAQLTGKKLWSLLYEYQIELENVKYTEYCKWLDAPFIIEDLYADIKGAIGALGVFNIHFIPLKFPTENSIQWEAEPGKIPLQEDVRGGFMIVL